MTCAPEPGSRRSMSPSTPSSHSVTKSCRATLPRVALHGRVIGKKDDPAGTPPGRAGPQCYGRTGVVSLWVASFAAWLGSTGDPVVVSDGSAVLPGWTTVAQ